VESPKAPGTPRRGSSRRYNDVSWQPDRYNDVRWQPGLHTINPYRPRGLLFLGMGGDTHPPCNPLTHPARPTEGPANRFGSSTRAAGNLVPGVGERISSTAPHPGSDRAPRESSPAPPASFWIDRFSPRETSTSRCHRPPRRSSSHRDVEPQEK